MAISSLTHHHFCNPVVLSIPSSSNQIVFAITLFFSPRLSHLTPIALTLSSQTTHPFILPTPLFSRTYPSQSLLHFCPLHLSSGHPLLKKKKKVLANSTASLHLFYRSQFTYKTPGGFNGSNSQSFLNFTPEKEKKSNARYDTTSGSWPGSKISEFALRLFS